MATQHNFRIKNGLEVGGVLIVDSSGQLQATTISGAISATSIGVTNIVTNKVVKFNGSILDDSNITDTGSLITLGANTAVTGKIQLNDGADIQWAGGYGSNKPLIAANSNVLNFYTHGASGGVEFALTGSAVDFKNNPATNVGAITASGAHVFTANDVDFIVQDTTDSVTNYIWRHHGNSKLYLGTQNAIVDIRSPIQLNSTQIFDTSRNMSNIGTISSGVLSVNSGTTNIAATFQSTDGIAGIKLQDSSGNVELSASGSTFRVQPSGGTPVLEINSSGNATFTGTISSIGATISGAPTDTNGLLTVSNTHALGGIYYPSARFVNARSNHSYGIVAEFRTDGTVGTDRPSILFTTDLSSHTWQVGQGTSPSSAVDDFVIGYRGTSNDPDTFAVWSTPFLTLNHTTGNATFAGTIDTGQGATEVYLMNQNVRTSDSPTFQNLTVQGNLSITGDINSYNVTDLDVTDKTITVGAGQTEANSGGSGLIVDGSAASMLWDEGDNRFEFNKNIYAPVIYGSGAGITALNASNLSSGTIPEPRLPTQTKYLRSDVADSGGTTTGSSLNIPYLKTNMLLVGATNFGDTINGSPWYGLGKSTLVGYHSNNSTMSQLANYWGLRLQTATARMDMTPTGYTGNILFGAGTDVSGTTWARINSTGLYQGLSNLVWHAGNDGSGSTLDADLLDGQHGSYYYSSANPPPTYAKYLRSDTADTASGKITFTVGESVELTGIRGGAVGSQSGDFIHLYERVNIGNPSGWGASSANAPTFGLSTHGGAQFNIGNVSGAPLTFNGNTIWRADNDGAGSGLDADLLDGQQGSYYYSSGNPPPTYSKYLRSDTDDTMTGDLTIDSASGWNSGNGMLNVGGGGDGRLQVRHIWGKSSTAASTDHIWIQYANNSKHVQIGQSGGGNNLYVADEIYAGGYFSGNIVWNAGNDGSGSGLDADTLDGQHGSYYAPASSIPSVGNGTLTVATAGSASGGGTFTANQSGNTTITVTGATIPTSLPANGGNSDTVDNMHFHNQLGVGEKIDFTVGGDAATYYPVVISGGGGDRITDFQIYRGYSETAPSSWGSSTHMGGLSFNYKIMGSAGWGGYPTGIRVQEFGEVYRRILGGIAYTAHTMKHVVWLRGGTASYHIWSNADISIEVNDSTSASNYVSASPHKWYSYDSSNNAYDVTVSERTSAQADSGVANEVYLNMPVSYNSAGTPAVYGIATSAYNHKFWNSSNDGSGSGLDADLLDGINSGSFVRSDITNSINLTITGVMQANNGYKVGSTTRINSVGDMIGTSYYIGSTNIIDTSANLTNIGTIGSTHFNTSANVNSSGAGGAYFTNGKRLGFDQTGVRSWTVYAAGGNLLFASGDGNGAIQANAVTAATGDFSGAVQFQGTAAIEGGTAGSGYGVFKGYAPNDNHFIAVRGAVATGQSTPNLTGAHQTTFVEHAENNDTTGWYWKSRQTGTYQEIGRLTRTGGFKRAGYQVWDASNDGSGSGLDADTVDGQHASAFLTAETLSSTNTVTVTGTKYWQPAGSATSPLGGGGGASLQAYAPNNGTAAYMAFHRSSQYAINWGLDTSNTMVLGGWSSSTTVPRMSIGTNGLMVTAGQGNLWGAGNDGSGSGLDADLLDGIQASSFMRGGRTLTTIDTISNGGDRYDPSTNNPTNEHYAVLTYGNGGNVTGQLATHFQTGNLYSRGYNSSWSAWRKNWNSLNDGSGSGLDADLLDGQQGSYYAPASGGNYWPTSGSWWASNMPGSRARGTADNGGEIVVLQDNPSTSRTSLLVDGQYYAGENGGFYSLYSGNNYNVKSGWNTNTSGQLLFSTQGHAQFNTQFGNIQIGPMNASYCHIYTNIAGGFYFNKAALYADGNTMWHAGNDGSGSGLDADLLDGYNAVEGAVNNSIVKRDGTASIKAHGLSLMRVSTATTGISWYSESYYNWQDYMAAPGQGSCGPNGNLTPPTGLAGVTSWALRSRMEGVSSYGWNWETGGGGGGGATATSKMSLNATTGNLALVGTCSASGFYDQNSSGFYVDPATSTNLQGTTTTPALKVTQTGGGGNVIGSLFQNAGGNFAWGCIAEYRINGTTGTDKPSIIFSHANNTETYTVGFGYTDSNFRIKKDHGHRNGGWGTALMTMDRSGNVTFAGNVTAYSDERLKTEIKTIENPLDTISKLRGVTFKWKESGDDSMGVIAQEVEAIAETKCLVSETPEDGNCDINPKNVAYGNMVGLLIEGMKEQQTVINRLVQDIKDLKDKIK